MVKPSLIGVLVGLLVLLLAGFHVYRWAVERQMADARVELANAKAEADTLRLVAGAHGDSVRLWERRARILTDDLDEAVDELGILGRRLEEADREAQVLASMYVEVRDSRVLESTARAGRDSTHIGFAFADSLFEVKGITSFPGRITPDPEPQALTALEIRARIRALLSVSCDEDGAPYGEAQALDPRVRVVDLQVAVARRVSCFPPPPGFLDLIPQPSIGTGVVAAAAFVAGMVFGGR